MSSPGRAGEDGGLLPRTTLRVSTVYRASRITSDSGTHGFGGTKAETVRSRE